MSCAKRAERASRAAVVLAALSLFGRPAAAGDGEPAPAKVFVIGIDGASWTVLRPLLARGRLPNLARLVKGGTSGVLESERQNLISPAMWTTIATGRQSADHGITDFTHFGVRTTRKDRRVKAIWNILSAHGDRVLVDGWLMTWPPEVVRGAIVSDLSLNSGISEPVSPPGILPGPVAAWDDLSPAEAGRLRRFIDYDYEPDAAQRGPSADPERQRRVRELAWVYMRDESLVRAAETLLPKVKPDLFAIHLWGTDQAAHAFWRYREPDGRNLPPEDVRRFGAAVDRYYEWTDEAVGRLLRLAPKGAVVVVVSDHGFSGCAAGDPERDHGCHEPEGVLIANGPGIRAGREIRDATIFDVMPTLLYLYRQPAARDMPGDVLVNLFEPKLVRDRPLRWIETYEDGRQPHDLAATDSPLSPMELERLRAVGYLK